MDQRLVDIEEIERLNEANKFENFISTKYVESGEPVFDHTHLLPNPETPDPDDKLYPDAHITSYLTGSGGRVYGPATSLKVMPGDEIDLQVFYKYGEIPTDDNPGKVLADILISTFQGTFYKVGGEYLVKHNIVNDDFLTAGMEVIGGENAETIPDAYLNYIIFDQNFENPEGYKIPIDSDGKVTNGTEDHGDISHNFTIDQAGYVYVYLSNETFNTQVYFDDLLISHTKSRVIQKNDYYPFGMENMALSFSRDDIIPNKFLYQGQELQVELDLDWYQFKWRMHNTALGKFSSIDPLSEDYVYNSTYAFSENQVIDGIELEGLEQVDFRFNKYDYNGTWWDYPNAINNGVINLLNYPIDIWNSGVANYQALSRGTWATDVGNEFGLMYDGIGNYFSEIGKYATSRPISQQIVETGKSLIQPESLEMATTMFVGSKIPSLKVPKMSSFNSGKNIFANNTISNKFNQSVIKGNTNNISSGALRMKQYGQYWQKASLDKAITRHAGRKPTSWVSKTGKTIYENPATSRQVVVDQAGYFRIFQPKTFGSTKGVYLDMYGKVPSPARYLKGGRVGNIPLTGGELNQATHFIIW